MKLEIKIPEIAENVSTGLIAGILVSKGDEIEKEQSVVEVETDKATTEIPSPYEGRVEEIRVSEGDEVEVGQVIIVLEGTDETGKETDQETQDEKATKAEKGTGKQTGDEESEEPEEKDESKDEDSSGEAGTEDIAGEPEDEDEAGEPQDKTGFSRGADIPASPLARRIARESGIEISRVKGSGPSDRIMSRDVRNFIEQGNGSPGTGTSSEEYTAEPLSNIRKLTAVRMSESWRQVPHVTQFDEADITDLEQYRQQVQERYEKSGTKLTVTSILVKIAGFALQRYPGFNASLDEKNEQILYKHKRHIGIAVDTDRGLLVPVIRDADRKPLQELTAEMNELAEKARNKKISPDDLQGGTFTISNLGGIGGTAFTPIVYTPQVAILGVSRSSYKQVDRDGEFQRRLMLPLSLSYDHRVIDGAEGARFLRWICNALENPYALLD